MSGQLGCFEYHLLEKVESEKQENQDIGYSYKEENFLDFFLRLAQLTQVVLANPQNQLIVDEIRVGY